MTGDNEKTQPQELLESVLPDPDPTPEFPTLREQQEYWDKKDRQAEDDRQVENECRREAQAQLVQGHPCPDCDRVFPNKKGLTMHTARVHTGTIVALGQKTAPSGRPIETLDTNRKKWSLARRRRYNAKRKAMEGTPPWPRGIVDIPDEEVIIPTLKYCPHCGENIGGWRFQP